MILTCTSQNNKRIIYNKPLAPLFAANEWVTHLCLCCVCFCLHKITCRACRDVFHTMLNGLAIELGFIFS